MEGIHSDSLNTIELGNRDERTEQHLLIIEDTQGKREFQLTQSVHSVGRNLKCDIFLASTFASRYHAAILHMPFSEQENGHYCIIDGTLNGNLSANGLFVNGKKVAAHDLQDGDQIVFGPDVKATYYRLTSRKGSMPPSELDETIEANIHDYLNDGISMQRYEPDAFLVRYCS